MSTNLIKIANFMQRLAYDAEKIVRKHKIFKTMDKGRHDVVTEIDLMIERHCIERIKQAYPNATVVSEEYNKDNLLGNSCFVIDPIDGTKNFAHGLVLWGFQMAYVENGETLVSVINLPELHYFTKAIKGQGTTCNGKHISYKPCDLEHSLWLVDGNNARGLIWDDLYRDAQGARNTGSSAYAYSMMVAGKVSGVINRKAWAWDVLPGYFACENAGLYCKMLDNGIQIVTVSPNLLDYACEKLSKAGNTILQKSTKKK